MEFQEKLFFFIFMIKFPRKNFCKKSIRTKKYSLRCRSSGYQTNSISYFGFSIFLWETNKKRHGKQKKRLKKQKV